MKPFNNFFSFLLLIMLSACSNSFDRQEVVEEAMENMEDPENEPLSILAPSATSLIFPENNTECNEGEPFGETQSRVTFRWTSSENTDSYSVNVTDLNANDSFTVNTTENEADIIIARGVPYEWFVISRVEGSNEIATSESWRFYNQGFGLENYAPFPAGATYPNHLSILPSSTTSLNLEWNATDVDNDIQDFEVFFGPLGATLTSSGILTEPTFEVQVVSNTIYEWKVMVNDEFGNTSESDVFQFKIE